MGPSAIRYAGLIDELEAAGVECEDMGNVRVPPLRFQGDGEQPVANANHLDEVAEVSSRLADEVADACAAGALPIVIGGDHSLAIGTVAGAARDADLGLVWFDAHGDYNTPDTSPSGNIHGMPLAASLGKGAFADMDWARADGLREENVVWVGLRDLDDAEAKAIKESDATAYTMADIDERGINEVTEEALDVAAAGVDGLHISLDLDWLDPQIAPGVGTPVRGGVTFREAHAAMETVAERDRSEGILHSFEVVEVNPILDSHNQTAELAAEFTASALGKRVL